MLAGVNVKTPVAVGVRAPTLISRISPWPFPMTTFPNWSKTMWIVPFEQVIWSGSGAVLVRGWQPPPIAVQLVQFMLEVHDVPPLEQSDVQAIAVEGTSVTPAGLTSVAQKDGAKFTSNWRWVRSGPV